MESHFLYTIDEWASNVNYYIYQYWIDNQDPRTRHLPLIDIGPLFIIVLLTFYYVLVKLIIPRYMEDREPFVLRKTILFYNAVMAMGNLWAFILCFIYVDFREFFNFVYPTDKTLTPNIRKEIVLGNYFLNFDLFEFIMNLVIVSMTL